jgi:hypothetical protein
MRTAMSGEATGAALLIVGLVIGAGLVLVVTYVNGGPTPRTVTVTTTETTILVYTLTNTFRTTASFVTVTATVTSCQWSGTHEYCEIVLSNTGNSNTATTGNCSMSYGSKTYVGYTGPTLASSVSPGAAQQLISGGSATVYCQASSGEAAGSGVMVNGTLSMGYGGVALFSGSASS